MALSVLDLVSVALSSSPTSDNRLTETLSRTRESTGDGMLLVLLDRLMLGVESLETTVVFSQRKTTFFILFSNCVS